jgi:glycosyltransferase involved in cell wall biosynthesis
MNNRVFLITAGFPFGTHETFLETEINYLCDGFEQVTIVAVDPTSDLQRQVPSNCTVVALRAQLSGVEKLLSMLGLLDKRVWEELRVIKKIYRQPLSLGKLKTMLISLARAKKIGGKLKKLAPLDNQTVLYSYWCDDSAMALALFSEERKVSKTVCRMHRWDIYFEESSIGYLPYRHIITKNISRIFSISQNGMDYAKQVWKTGQDEKFILSRLGINNELSLKTVNRDYFLLVSCSNLIPVKRVHLIAEALLNVAEQRLKWVHIGDGPERTRIEKITKNLPKNIDVEFMGRIPNVAIYDYYDEHRPDAFINVSSSEGVPVSIMEAMSFGIPVIATDVGGNGEIAHDTNGILLSNHPAVKEIAEAIAAFFQPSKAKAKADGAYRTWKERYNAEVNYSQFVQELKTKT